MADQFAAGSAASTGRPNRSDALLDNQLNRWRVSQKRPAFDLAPRTTTATCGPPSGSRNSVARQYPDFVIKPVLPPRTSTSPCLTSWFVLCTVIGRRPMGMLYSSLRMIVEMRSSPATYAIYRAMSYAEDTLAASSPEGSA